MLFNQFVAEAFILQPGFHTFTFANNFFLPSLFLKLLIDVIFRNILTIYTDFSSIVNITYSYCSQTNF